MPSSTSRHYAKTRKRENNRIESDHVVLKHRLRSMHGVQGLTTAKAIQRAPNRAS
ncbi:DDE-type integrase/transposase/recombinase [Jannaschia seosinensis]|uniref:DDE-type integrase/transposase/recombinase n=1 Tax=Jannaschia seosinensis TaxID=313367 RepID=UPI003521EB78